MSMTQSRAVAAPSTSATSRTQAETQPPPTRIQFPTRQRDEMPWFGPTLSFPFQLLLWCRSRPHRPPQPAAADAAVAAVAASSSSRGWTESENHRVYDHVTSILSLSLPSKHNQHHPSSSQSIPHYQQQSVGVFSPKIPSRHCKESQTASTSRTKEITRNRHSHHKCRYNLDKTSLNCRFVASRQTNWVPGVVACKWKPKKPAQFRQKEGEIKDVDHETHLIDLQPADSSWMAPKWKRQRRHVVATRLIFSQLRFHNANGRPRDSSADYASAPPLWEHQEILVLNSNILK